MSLRRIAGVAAAVVVSAGAGLLLSSPTSAVTPTPISLEASGMSSPSCPLPTGPLGVYGSIALKPGTTVLLKNDDTLGALSSESVTIKPAPDSTDQNSSKTIAAIPAAGASIPFARAATYNLSWQIRSLSGTLTSSQNGKLVISSNAQNCVIAVQLPLPSVSASAVPSPITSAINGGVGAVISGVNGALGSVVAPLPTGVPPLPGAPSVPPLPGAKPPATKAPAGADGPGTIYKPSGPTVADRTVPKGYGSGSGLGGSFVSANGNSITAPAQQPAGANGNGTQAGRKAGSSPATPVKAGGSPKTVELASNRPRSALGALPTLVVIVAILALSGATAFYARTFLLQPAAARSKS